MFVANAFTTGAVFGAETFGGNGIGPRRRVAADALDAKRSAPIDSRPTNIVSAVKRPDLAI